MFHEAEAPVEAPQTDEVEVAEEKVGVSESKEAEAPENKMVKSSTTKK